MMLRYASEHIAAANEQKTRHADDRLKHYEQCHKEKAPNITLPDLQLADTSAIHLLLHDDKQHERTDPEGEVHEQGRHSSTI